MLVIIDIESSGKKEKKKKNHCNVDITHLHVLHTEKKIIFDIKKNEIISISAYWKFVFLKLDSLQTKLSIMPHAKGEMYPVLAWGLCFYYFLFVSLP